VSEVDPTACADAYRDLRERVTALIRECDPAALDAIAPATPEWRVRDVLAHMAGVNTDIVNGVLDGVGTDPWTAAQVAARRDWPIEQVLEEWAERATEVEANAPILGPAVGQWVFDACTHEHDVRQALGAPGGRDSAAVAIGFAWATDRLSDALDRAGAPGLCLHTDAGTKVVGSTGPRTGVHTSSFEIVRTMTGRRSRRQIEAYEWDGPARPGDLVLGIFSMRTDDFVE
jgi:uncharacterized protein (TIGR03083 family)